VDHALAGTELPALTSIGIPELQQPQEASRSASLPSIGAIPQGVPYAVRKPAASADLHWERRREQENGAARHNSPWCCVMKA
jgi:hypothetical protein